MRLFPSFPEFSSLSREAGIIPVWREFLFDTDTAVTAYEKLYRPPFGFLLESVVGGEQWARYSFLGSQPREAWRLKHGKISLWRPERGWEDIDADDPLEDLDRRLRAREPARVSGLPRFWGGAVGFFGYDVVRHIEDLPDAPVRLIGLQGKLVVQDCQRLAPPKSPRCGLQTDRRPGRPRGPGVRLPEWNLTH